MAHGIQPLLGRMLLATAMLSCVALGCESAEPSTSAPERRMEVYSPGQIAQVVTSINDGEIAQAEAALGRLLDEEVRAYADMVLKEHEAAERRLSSLMQQKAIDEEESDLQKEMDILGQNMVRHIQRENALLADQTYLEVQIFIHRKALSVVRQELLPVTGDSAMREYLDDFDKMLQRHLYRAITLRKRYPATEPWR